MTRLPGLTAVCMMLLLALPIYAGVPGGQSTWQQRLATITPDGSLVTFLPLGKFETKQVTEYRLAEETITKSVNGKEIAEVVTRQVPVTKLVSRFVVEWTQDGTKWS